MINFILQYYVIPWLIIIMIWLTYRAEVEVKFLKGYFQLVTI